MVLLLHVLHLPLKIEIFVFLRLLYACEAIIEGHRVFPQYPLLLPSSCLLSDSRA